MRKNEPIIFKVYNFHDDFCKLKLPYRKDLLVVRDDGKTHVVVDIKANTKWQKNIIPDEFEILLAPKQSMTILIKPHNDNYFAGWGRWFNWGAKLNETHSRSEWWDRAGPYRSARNELLSAVLSDPDYAHLQSETNIGDNFRCGQYSRCQYLTLAPDEDLDGEFEEIGKNFRNSQYADWGRIPLKNLPKESMPTGIKKIGENFRHNQYDDKPIPKLVEFVQKSNAEFTEILLENNLWIFEYISDEFKLEFLQKHDAEFIGEMFKENRWIFKHIPDEFFLKCNAELWEILIEKNHWIFKNTAAELKTKEMCKTAVKKDKTAVNYVPERFMTKEFWEMIPKDEKYRNEVLARKLKKSI